MGVSDSLYPAHVQYLKKSPGMSSSPESPLHWKGNSSIEELLELAPSWQDQLYTKIYTRRKSCVIKEEGESIRNLPVFTWPMSMPGSLASCLPKKTQEATEKDVEEK